MLLTLWGSLGFFGLMLALSVFMLVVFRRRSRAWRIAALAPFVAALPIALLCAYLGFRFAAGQPEPIQLEITDGVSYERLVLQTPNRAVVHIVEVDLAKGHTFVITPPEQTAQGLRTRAAISTDALDSLSADLVVNGSFFKPFRDQWFLDYRPHAGEFAEPRGPTVGDGQLYGAGDRNWPSLCVEPDGLKIGAVTDATTQAVSGKSWLVRGGNAVDAGSQGLRPYARTAVGLSADKQTLWIIVVDGKQPRYSTGLSLDDLADLFIKLGASDAVNLDGGGSATLAYRTDTGEKRLLSRPCHTKLPGRQRPVANHIGLRFAEDE